MFCEHFNNYVHYLGLCGSCCMPCQMADNADRLDENSGLFCLMTLFVPCIPVFLLRRKMRNRFGIEG